MINKISVSYKMGLAIMVIILSVLFPLGFIINQAVTNFYISNKQSELQASGEKLALTLLPFHQAESLKRTEELISLTNYQAIILNKQGHIVVNTGHFNFKPSKTAWQSLTKGNTIQKQWKSAEHSTYLLVGIPIVKNGQVEGVVLLFSSMDAVLSSVHDIRSSLMLAGFGAFLLAIGFTNFLSKRLSKPLIDMAAVTKKISEGNLNVRLKTYSKDELGQLSNSINNMASSLEHIQNQRKAFFANIAHELKTPITYLSGYADVLKKELVHSKEEQQRYFTIIQDESERLSKLVNDLFDLAILDEGKLELSLEPVEVNAILFSICQNISVMAKEKGLAFKPLHSKSPLWIQADSYRMKQVFLNLLINAIRYTIEGEVRVETYVNEQMVFIEIEDTGIGISEDDQKRIFGRFFRTDESRSRQTGGTGLGLAIVRELVEKQNGTIEVTSIVGKGTRFILKFPQIKGEDHF